MASGVGQVFYSVSLLEPNARSDHAPLRRFDRIIDRRAVAVSDL